MNAFGTLLMFFGLIVVGALVPPLGLAMVVWAIVCSVRL